MRTLPVSVVVPSWRRPADLRRCLTAVAQQVGEGDEILAVVRGDDSETRTAVDALREHVDFHAIRLVEPAGPGLVAALGAGLEAATNPVVCFTDDDVVARSGWLTRIAGHFERDPGLAGVGGRDWIHVDGATNEGSAARVGQVRWFGRVVGNHHLGVGAPREVQILKGANMSFRRAALSQVGFDPLLRGASSQPHNELGLCLELRRLGWRLLYDPQAAVDHYLAPRSADARSASRGRSFQHVAEATHNQLYGLMVGLRGWRRAAAVLFQLLVGSREDPGPVLGFERAVSGDGRQAIKRARAALSGRVAALGTYCSRRSPGRGAGRNAPAGEWWR